jgi:hypothetical protein
MAKVMRRQSFIPSAVPTRCSRTSGQILANGEAAPFCNYISKLAVAKSLFSKKEFQDIRNFTWHN